MRRRRSSLGHSGTCRYGLKTGGRQTTVTNRPKPERRAGSPVMWRRRSLGHDALDSRSPCAVVSFGGHKTDGRARLRRSHGATGPRRATGFVTFNSTGRSTSWNALPLSSRTTVNGSAPWHPHRAARVIGTIRAKAARHAAARGLCSPWLRFSHQLAWNVTMISPHAAVFPRVSRPRRRAADSANGRDP